MMQKRKQGKKVVLWLLCLITVLSIVNLPTIAMTAKAAEYYGTVSGRVGVPMDEIVHCVGDDGYYPGIAKIMSGNMPNGLKYDVDDCGNVHFVGTPEEAGTFEVEFYTEEYDEGYLYQNGFVRTIIIEEPEPEKYGVWAGGIEFDSDHLTATYGSGTATYDPDTRTLTLNGVKFDACDEDAIFSKYDLVINVIGDNTIENCLIGIEVNEGKLTLCGDGNLSIKADDGILSHEGDIVITDKVNIEVVSDESCIWSVNQNLEISGSGKMQLSTTGRSGCPIRAGGNMTLAGSGDITIDAQGDFYAVFLGKLLTFSGNGNVNITTTGSGIRTVGGVVFENHGKVALTCTGTGDIYGIFSFGNVIFSGSGEVSIAANWNSIRLWNLDDKVLLNGTNNPISLKTGAGRPAIYNYELEGSPVAGTNFDNYKASGSLDSTNIEFTLKCMHSNLTNREIRQAEPAGCVKNGYTGDIYCTDCGEMIEAGTVIPATGTHNYTKKIISDEYLASAASATSPAKYYYACEVCGQKGTKTYTNGSATQLATPKLSAPTVNEKSIVVKWGKVTDAALYRVYKKDEAGSWKKVSDVKTTSFEDTEVVSGTSYTYTVRCVSADRKTTTSAYDKTGVTATYCSMPVLKSATPSEEGAKVTWNKVTGAGAYRVYRKVSGGSWAKVADTVETSYVDKTAVSGTTYIYTVRCMDASKTVSTSVYDKNGISITYCSVPVLKSIAVNNDGIKVTWGAVTGAAKYRVYRKTNDGSWKKIDVVTTTAYTDKTATPGAKYAYTVMCANADDTVNYSTYDKNGKGVTLCANPVLKSTTTLDGAVKVTWGKVTGASGYRVYRKIAGGSWKAVGDTKEVSFNDTTVESGTKYIYSVRCLDADGTTCISGYDTTGITVLYCAMPKITTLTSTTKGVKATWGAVTGAAKYRVYRKVPGGSWAKVTDTTATSYVDTTAVKGTQYVYTVRCLDADGKTFVSAYDTTGKTITFK